MARIGIVALAGLIGIAHASGCKDGSKPAASNGVTGSGSNRRPVPTADQRKAAEAVARRAKATLQQEQTLAMKELATQAERLAADPDLFEAITTTSVADRATRAKLGFQRFLAKSTGDHRPDILALVDAAGDVLAMHDVPTAIPKQWRSPDAAMTPTILPALNVALAYRATVATTWKQGDAALTVGVASISPRDEAAGARTIVIGAALLAYKFPVDDPRSTARRLAVELAYHDGRRIVASSFGAAGPERSKARPEVDALLADVTGLDAVPRPVTVENVDYIVTAVAMPRAADKAGGDPSTPEFGTLIFAPMIVPDERIAPSP